MPCEHKHQSHDENGYECLDCGQAFGHFRPWKRRRIAGRHYPGDDAHVKRCRECREGNDRIETLSADRYEVQPWS